MLANEYMIKAEGWSEQFDIADNVKNRQEHLDFAHSVAKTFNTKYGKEVLNALVKQYLVNGFNSDNDPYSIIRKQGRADVVKQILGQIEISNKV